MSLLLAGLIVAGASGAVAVGRWLAKRRDASPTPANEAESKGDDPADPATNDEREESAKKPARRIPSSAEGPHAHLDGFPCQLGDVVMRMTGEEAWLAGGLVLSEEVPVAALFVAPDAGHDCALYVRPKPRESIFWMEPLDPGAVLVAGEPPTSVEHGGVRFDRARRLPLRPRRIGVGAPDVGDAVVIAEYASSGAERLLVMKGSSGAPRAFRGLELEPSSFEVIASGRSTLDDAG